MAESYLSSLEKFYPVNRKEWRSWLSKNYNTALGVWLVLHKKNSTKPTVSYNDAVEEALCFGWIDSKPNKLDEEAYLLLFTPRKAKSVWSKPNKERIERLVQQGLMMEAGMRKIEAAKKDGSWEALKDIDEMRMPGDLKKALAVNKAARTNFEQFPPSAKKNIYLWIKTAKKLETRAKRVSDTVTLAAKNVRANQYRPPERSRKTSSK
jgi:uncharacterized protein YdeI (YjbR/CyaY-like superfamily)